MSKIVLPYEPDYVGGREAEKRRKETKEWLRQRERELAEPSPPLAPEPAAEDEKANSTASVARPRRLPAVTIRRKSRPTSFGP
jgi:hypothetical protein